MRIVFISDTHTKYEEIKIPECDILISAGDYSGRGETYSVVHFHRWLSKQPAKEFISVQGNHEVWVEKHWHDAWSIVNKIDERIRFVREESFVLEGIKFHCSAWSPEFCGWAFGAKRGEDIAKHWALIPDDTQVLVTHGPPYGILDTVFDGAENLGCRDLRKRLENLKRLKIHAFGHIHGGYGAKLVDGKLFVNASVCNEKYTAVNPVSIVDTE